MGARLPQGASQPPAPARGGRTQPAVPSPGRGAGSPGLTPASAQDLPEQTTGCDCGVFTVKYADFVARSVELSGAFRQQDMLLFRRRMIAEARARGGGGPGLGGSRPDSALSLRRFAAVRRLSEELDLLRMAVV